MKQLCINVDATTRWGAVFMAKSGSRPKWWGIDSLYIQIAVALVIVAVASFIWKRRGINNRRRGK